MTGETVADHRRQPGDFSDRFDTNERIDLLFITLFNFPNQLANI